MPPIPVPPMGRARPTDGRCRSRGTRRKWLPTVFHYVADQRTEPTCKPRCCLGRAGGSPRFELELQLGPPLLVGLLGQAKIGLSGADLLDGALERVETQGIDAALIQPYSGHASRESLSGSKVHRWLGLGRGRGVPGSGGDLDAAGPVDGAPPVPPRPGADLLVEIGLHPAPAAVEGDVHAGDAGSSPAKT
jgi:hypothetical protein